MATTGSVSFGPLLRRYRRAAGLTQEELAERALVSKRSLGDMERGVPHTPRTDTVALLADALDLTPDQRAAFAAAARRLGTPSAARAMPEGPAPPPFVGRGGELALLERHLAGEGPPVLLLAGEPGIGKTRLLQAAAPRALGDGFCVLEGGCQRRGGHAPFAPLLGALQRHLRAQRPARLRADLRGCAWLVRLLPELAAGPIEPLPAWTLPPAQERRLMVEAVARFLANVAGPAGTLLLLDDLHWADPDALDLLATLARAAAEIPVRIVGAYRDTEVQTHDPLAVMLADLAQAGLAARRLLGPLAPAEAAHLLDGLLEGLDDVERPAEAGAGVRERVLERAGGVPFFVVSWAQSLRLGAMAEGSVQRGAAVEQGAAVGGSPGGIPWDLAQGLRQRVAALPGPAREALGVAAVVGREAPRTLVANVMARPERAVLDALDAACRARLLEEGVSAYRFVHDVIREVVEADLGAGRRMLLHREIAAALEQEWDAARGHAEALVEALAYHYARTEEHAGAALWLERAGDQAAVRLARATALDHYAAAYERLLPPGVAPSDGAAEALSRLAEKQADVYLNQGAFPQARALLAQARAQATQAMRRAELWYKEGMSYRWQGATGKALAAFRMADGEGGPAVGEGGTALPPRLRAAIALGRAILSSLEGDVDAVDRAARQAARFFGESGTGTGEARSTRPPHSGQARRNVVDTEACLAHAVVLQGAVAQARGDGGLAERYYRQGLALYEATGDAVGVGLALIYLTDLAYEQGHLAAAENSIQRAWQLMEEGGSQYGVAAALRLLGEVTLAQGRLAQAEDVTRHSLACAEQLGHHGKLIDGWANLGRVALSQGNLAAAAEHLHRALALCEQRDGRRDDQHAAAGVWLDLGLLACECGDHRGAARWCRMALRQARRLGITDLEAHATLGAARSRLLGGQVRSSALLLAHGQGLAGQAHTTLPALEASLLTGEVRLRQGLLGEAQAATEDAVRRARQQGRRIHEGLGQRLLGQCLLAAGQPAAATTHLRAALDLLGGAGAALEVARTHLVLARALAAGSTPGRPPDEARALMAEARAGFAAVGAPWNLARVEHIAVE